MKNITIRLLTSIFAAFALLFTVGCETGEGLGEDVEEAGEEIEDAAEDAQ